MRTAILVYIMTWILLVVPLLLFNLKRMRKKRPDGSYKIRWGFISFIGVICVIISVFLFSAYQTTIQSRYELAAERFVQKHGEYLTGRLSFDEFVEETSSLYLSEAAIPAEDMLFVQGSSADSVRFQIGDWITPKYFRDVEGFPKIEIIEEESNPVFIFCSINSGDVSSFFLLGMKSDDKGQNWRIFCYEPLPEEIETNTAFNSYKPNAKNGKWFYISS